MFQGSAMDSRMVKYAKVVNSLVDSMVNNVSGPQNTFRDNRNGTSRPAALSSHCSNALL
jgi:hypothetical protein